LIIKKHTNKGKTYFNKPKGVIPIFQYPRTGNEIFNEKSITQPLDRFNRKKNKPSNTWTEPIARKTNCPTLGQNQSQEKQTVQPLDRFNRKKNKPSNTWTEPIARKTNRPTLKKNIRPVISSAGNLFISHFYLKLRR